MKSLDDRKLQRGDIILSTQDHYESKAIRLATKSDISHAMLYVATGSVIDSTGEGVHARSTRRMFFDDNCAIHVRRLRAGLSDEQRERVVVYARGQIGTRYSAREAVRSATGTNRVPSRQQFCSRLVAQAYAWAGIPIVDSPAYCTPDDVKNSALLEPVPNAVIAVSDDYVAQIERHFDTNDVMRDVTNRLLESARTKSAAIESLNDINEYLEANPAEDMSFAKFYEESGYLTAWEAEFNKNRWQYDLRRLVEMPGSHEEKRAYCAGVVEDHPDMLQRRDRNRAGYTVLYQAHGLKTFALLKALYEKLVDLQSARRAVALQWMQRFTPDALPGPIDTIALNPHTKEWFAVLEKENPEQAVRVRRAIQIAGSAEVCTFCGDSPARDHRFTGDDVQPCTVITCKLCEDCGPIRKAMYGESFELMD